MSSIFKVYNDDNDNETDLVKYKWNRIATWYNKDELWPLNHGHNILGLASGLTGFLLNIKYRRIFKLRQQAVMSSHLPLIIFPIVNTRLTHKKFVTEKIFVSFDECPVCIELRAMFWQGVTGVFYTTILSYVSCSMLANSAQTYNLPYVTDVTGHLKLYCKMTKKVVPFCAKLFLFHAILASVITYQEMKCNYYLNDAFYLEEEDRRSLIKQ